MKSKKEVGRTAIWVTPKTRDAVMALKRGRDRAEDVIIRLIMNPCPDPAEHRGRKVRA